jgi:signal transduction histidine kinase
MLERDPSQRQVDERLHAFSHDVKNKLGALWQAAQLLAELPPGPDRDALLGLAEKSHFEAARRLEELLDGFGVPRGTETARPQPLELRPVLDKAIAAMAFRTGPKQQRFEVHADGSQRVMADPALVQRCVEALLSNACKFSPAGAVIHLSVRAVATHLHLRVQDPGTGLTPEDLQMVFVRYAMLSSKSTAGESQARSTLQRARQWAQAQGGNITAESAGPGSGSIFALTLPLAA